MNEQELATLAKHYFFAFPKLVSNNKIPYHNKVIADKVQEALEAPTSIDRYRLLIISEPPRHGKSELLSKHLPAWALGKWPNKRIILTSYSSDLSDTNSDKARGVFETWAPKLWDVYPSKKLFNRSQWNTDQDGGVISAGVGGSITGHGADLLLIDDYVKGDEEAESQAQRDKIWRWWESVATTRLHPGALVIIIATRWNDDDLIGRLQKQKKDEGDDFPFDLTDINLPAVATEDNDLIGRKQGEALWPKRYSVARLKNVKKIVGSYVWNSLFQGDPVPRGGTLFKAKHFRYYDIDEQGNFLLYRKGEEEPLKVLERTIKRQAYVDPAIEIKKVNDPTGMAAWAYAPYQKVWMLLDVLVDRIEHTQVQKVIHDFAEKNKCLSVGIENEKLGKVLVKQSFGQTEIPFKEVPTKGLDKYARATPMATAMENERVFFPKRAHWLADYENELILFPRGKHDECVDITGFAKDMESKRSVTDVLNGR